MFLFLFLYDFIIFAGTTFIGVSLAFILTSQFAYSSSLAIDDIEKEEEMIDFENAYKEKFENLPITTLPENDIISEFVTHVTTPLGEVIMVYDTETECFNYYSQCRNIPVRFLNVVAQKFVLENNCKSLY